MPRYTESPLLPQIEVILAEAGRPMHYKEITKRLLELNAWSTIPKFPEKSVSHILSAEIRHGGESTLLRRTAPGVYTIVVVQEPKNRRRHPLVRLLQRLLGGGEDGRS